MFFERLLSIIYSSMKVGSIDRQSMRVRVRVFRMKFHGAKENSHMYRCPRKKIFSRLTKEQSRYRRVG